MDASGDSWDLQLIPIGSIYHSYLAGVKEPRFASVSNYEQDLGWIWDIALGGRVGLIRYGNRDSLRPDGWQLDFEGAVFPRLDLEHEHDVISMDLRAGVPLTYGHGPYRLKFAYYHLCLAINGHLREELDFGGNLVVQAGWQWRGPAGHLFRTGLQYFNGKSDQFEFYDRFEQKIGIGIWYDF